MARPVKNGIDYFPFNVHLGDDFELIEAEFGLTGFAVVVKLFQKIYGGQGYYCEWTNDVALLFGKKIGLGDNAVSEIVKAAIRRGIFDENLYKKYHILTSQGIQDRYLEAVNRRKKVEIEKQYLLINVRNLPDNVHINEVNVDINSKNVNINPKIKEKKSKEKKRKTEESSRSGCDKKLRFTDYVTLTSTEYEWLVKKHGKADVDRMIEILDSYKRSKGKTYASDFGAINKWVVTALAEEKQRKGQDMSIYNDDDVDYAALEKIMRDKM